MIETREYVFKKEEIKQILNEYVRENYFIGTEGNGWETQFIFLLPTEKAGNFSISFALTRNNEND